jgi:hypothetical protein
MQAHVPGFECQKKFFANLEALQDPVPKGRPFFARLKPCKPQSIVMIKWYFRLRRGYPQRLSSAPYQLKVVHGHSCRAGVADCPIYVESSMPQVCGFDRLLSSGSSRSCFPRYSWTRQRISMIVPTASIKPCFCLWTSWGTCRSPRQGQGSCPR